MSSLRIFDGGVAPPVAEETTPFSRVPVSALQDRRLTDTDVRLLGALLSHHFTRGDQVVKRNAELARAIGRTERTVMIALRRLEKHGYIACEQDLSIGNQRRIYLLFKLRGEKPASTPGEKPASGGGDPRISPGGSQDLPGGKPGSPHLKKEERKETLELRRPPPPVSAGSRTTSAEHEEESPILDPEDLERLTRLSTDRAAGNLARYAAAAVARHHAAAAQEKTPSEVIRQDPPEDAEMTR